MISSGTPTGRSANPSPSKSPAPSAEPNKSPTSALLLRAVLGEGLAADPVSPAAVPYSTLTASFADAADGLERGADGVATPSWSKSAAASAAEVWSSAVLPYGTASRVQRRRRAGAESITKCA
jgi:hypothetical protein